MALRDRTNRNLHRIQETVALVKNAAFGVGIGTPLVLFGGCLGMALLAGVGVEIAFSETAGTILMLLVGVGTPWGWGIGFLATAYDQKIISHLMAREAKGAQARVTNVERYLSTNPGGGISIHIRFQTEEGEEVEGLASTQAFQRIPEEGDTLRVSYLSGNPEIYFVGHNRASGGTFLIAMGVVCLLFGGYMLTAV